MAILVCVRKKSAAVAITMVCCYEAHWQSTEGSIVLMAAIYNKKAERKWYPNSSLRLIVSQHRCFIHDSRYDVLLLLSDDDCLITTPAVSRSVHQRFLSQTSHANISIDIPQCSSPSFRSPFNTLERCVRVKGQGRSDEEDGRWLRRNKTNNRGRVRPDELLP
jgi:hypothetical protein